MAIATYFGNSVGSYKYKCDQPGLGDGIGFPPRKPRTLLSMLGSFTAVVSARRW